MNDLKPQNLIMLAALGLGVYFLLVRKSSASSLSGRYNTGPSYPGYTGYTPPKAQPTNSNYVDLATSALTAWDSWFNNSAPAPAYVPDFTAANPSNSAFVGPQMPNYSDLNNWMEP